MDQIHHRWQSAVNAQKHHLYERFEDPIKEAHERWDCLHTSCPLCKEEGGTLTWHSLDSQIFWRVAPRVRELEFKFYLAEVAEKLHHFASLRVHNCYAGEFWAKAYGKGAYEVKGYTFGDYDNTSYTTGYYCSESGKPVSVGKRCGPQLMKIRYADPDCSHKEHRKQEVML